MLENLASLLGGSELFRWKGRQPTILKEKWMKWVQWIHYGSGVLKENDK